MYVVYVLYAASAHLQHDSHIPNLSVAETVDFAHTCHSGYGEPEFNLPGELCKAKVGVMAQNIACWQAEAAAVAE